MEYKDHSKKSSSSSRSHRKSKSRSRSPSTRSSGSSRSSRSRERRRTSRSRSRSHSRERSSRSRKRRDHGHKSSRSSSRSSNGSDLEPPPDENADDYSQEYSQTTDDTPQSEQPSHDNDDNDDDQTDDQEEEESSLIQTHQSYSTKILASTNRLHQYTAENDRLLDEVSHLRLQILEMQNDRSELVRAHRESMSLLAQVSEEKLVEYKSKSEQEAAESKAAQEEALRTVLEMMEKDCEERVAELDRELARIDAERARAAEMQAEAARRALEEERTKEEYEEACRLAVEKLVRERQVRSVEMQQLSEREERLLRELEETKRRAEREKEAAAAAAAAALASEAMASAGAGGDFGDDNRSGGSASYSQSSYDGSYDSSGGGLASSSLDSDPMSPLIPSGGNEHPGSGAPQDRLPKSNRPPIIDRRHAPNYRESIFLRDPPHEMTRGRRIALKLQNYSWYQPRGKGKNNKHWDVHGLGLQSAWAYFEHSVLPRYIVRNEDGSLPSLDGTEGQIGPGLSEDDQSEKQANVSVYEGSVGSSVYTPGGQDENDSVADSDVSDWLYKPNPSNKNGQGAMNGLGPKRTRQSGDLTRADPGESKFPTRLYSPFFTPLSQLGDFGIGVGLYFSSLRGIALITLIAGCINLPNILYFAGEEYSASQPGVDFLLKGSAICTEQVWVPCPTCLVDDFDRAKERIAGTTTVTPDGQLQTLVFALKNACDGATMQVGIFNMASLGFVLLAIAVLSLYQRRMQIKFDVQAQTAQDYSIVVFNPPADATEPEEWKEFFETRFGGHVTCCTVTKNNDLLVRALAERREILAIIEEKVKEGSLVNTLSLSELAARIEHGRHCFGNIKKRISPGIPELVGRLTVLNTKIQGLAQQQYNATRVFCTFETEASQRKVLQEMTVGSITAYKNKTHAVNTKLLFRGEHVLLIREAEEPSAIRWMDLDEKMRTRIKQISITTIISLVCIFAVAVIVTTCRQISAAAAALAISISNALFPSIAKTITNFESHASETGKQSSLFVKIAIFRWVITAIVITVIMPFTSTLTNGSAHLIQSIYIIFFADLAITNVLQILDPVSNFRRHFLAPRAGTQDRMNRLMGGTEYTIAERYTNMTKTLFLAFYYSAIYPSAFFMCFVNLFVSFFIDKFSLLRTWKPTPLLGPYIAKFSRIYFMTTAIAAMAITSSYFFAGFPYDNLCPEDVSHSAYYGTWQIINGDGEETIATIEPGERSYHFCNQFLGPGDNFAFPAFPDNQPPGSEWMTEEQERLTGIYAFVSVSVLGLLGLVFIYRMIRALQDLFSSKYKPQGADQGKNFSAKGNISSYVPQIQSDHFAHPLVAVNIDHVGENIFDWHDPDRSHSYYDLTRDAEKLLKGDEEVCYRAFGQIRHWPPNGRNPGERARDNGEDDFDGGGTSVSGASQATTRSALRKNKDPNNKRNVSWSSKVTCKTYSKDDPNNYDFFNANASTTRGMNFDGHSDPLYDPHTQNEARVNKKVPPSDDPAQPDLFYGDGQGARAPDPYYNDGLGDKNYQSNVQDPRNQQGQAPRAQPTVAEQFDPYYNTGLDYQNQQPDQMYGGSQTRDESSERSYDQSSGASSSFNQSDDLSQPSDASSYSQVPSESSEQRSDYDDESEIYGNSSQGSSYVSDQHAGVESPETWQQNSYHSGSDASNQYGSQQDYGSQGSSQQDYDSQGSQQEYYDGEGFVEGEQNWDNDGESGSFSAEDASSAGSSAGLPPVT